jgi:hypothetical protein
MANTKPRTDAKHRHRPVLLKPMTAAELRAKVQGELQLALANAYKEQGDLESALHHCSSGLRLTHGISRPLVVRDQLHDLARELENS